MSEPFDAFEQADDDPQEMLLADYEASRQRYRERKIKACPFASLRAHARKGCPRCNPEEWSTSNQTGDQSDA